MLPDVRVSFLRLQAPLFRLAFTPGARCPHTHCTYFGDINGSPAVIQCRVPKLHPLNPHPPSAAPFSRSLPPPSAPLPPPPTHLPRFVSCGHAERVLLRLRIRNRSFYLHSPRIDSAYAYAWSLTAPPHRRLIRLLRIPHRPAARRAHSLRADNSLTSTHSLLTGPLPATRFPPGSHLTAINAVCVLYLLFHYPTSLNFS
ncbi:hypothetical protein DFH08DRAFT_1038251 [Mycena albidolilacea]|uniref:Uncharacterized protein n=1 Tax=Mycena albidolilacea TaxID=1033008 RepID=A0AAD7F0T5_9AGAR|nr:hypothetical protein DFH08DRAFT_1038251 [Mycena albidolilacea]